MIRLLDEVGLPRPEELAARYPHQLSGGQQQRVTIAAALAGDPEVLVLDEPTTALDVTSQARILALLTRLCREHRMGMLYVTHDLGVLAQVCDRIAVMYAGQIVERASTSALFHQTRHPYSRALIAAVPGRGPGRGHADALLPGVFRRRELPVGCPLAPRCPYAERTCAERRQSLVAAEPAHEVACWKWQTVARPREAHHA